MRAIVVHDEQGNIVSIAVPEPDAEGELKVVAGRGERVAEVDADLGPGDREGEVAERLERVAREHRIDVSSRAPKLVRRG